MPTGMADEAGQDMDPVAMGAVLAAIAGGAGGEVGSQLWARLSTLVRRPYDRVQAPGEAAALLPSGAAELAALERAPDDERRVLILTEVLVAGADADAEFGMALQAWWGQACKIQVGEDGTSTVSGGI
jgi:hypothetical protein